MPAPSQPCRTTASCSQPRCCADDGEWELEVPHGEGTMVYLSANVVHSGRWEHGQPQGQGERRDRSRGAVWRGEFVPHAAVGLEGEGAVLHGEGEERPQGERGERYVGQFDAGTRHGSRWKGPSTRLEDSAPSARLVPPGAQAALTHPRAPPEPRGRSPWLH